MTSVTIMVFFSKVPSSNFLIIAMFKVLSQNQQMNIQVIIQVKKIQEIDIIQVLFKASSIFQRFNWYNSHSQGEDVEWKTHITI